MKSNWGTRSAVLLTILSIICVSSTCFAESEWVYYQGTGFSVKIPANFKVDKTTPVEDFDIFRLFDASEKQILGIYAGNHSQFPERVPKGVKLQEGMLGDKPIQKAEWTDKDGFHGEFLVRLYPEDAPGVPFPVFIHIWCLKLNIDEMSITRRILDTLQSVD